MANKVYDSLNEECRYVKVVYWDVLEKKYASEVSQQQDVFGGEQAEQRKKDFRSDGLPPALLFQPCCTAHTAVHLS